MSYWEGARNSRTTNVWKSGMDGGVVLRPLRLAWGIEMSSSNGPPRHYILSVWLRSTFYVKTAKTCLRSRCWRLVEYNNFNLILAT